MSSHYLPATGQLHASTLQPIRTASDGGEDEGRQLGRGSDRVSYAVGSDLPYRAVLTRARGVPLYQSFATMREAEAFVRSNSPPPAPGLSTLYDRPSDS